MDRKYLTVEQSFRALIILFQPAVAARALGQFSIESQRDDALTGARAFFVRYSVTAGKAVPDTKSTRPRTHPE